MGQYLNDTFTGADGAALISHVGELGASWTAIAGFAGATHPIIFQNRLCALVGTSQFYLTSGVERTDGAEVSANIKYFNAAACGAGVVTRADASAKNCYFVWWHADGSVYLQKMIAGVVTTLASGASALSTGAAVALTIKTTNTSGSTVTVEVFIGASGTPLLSVADTAADRIATFGKAGIFLVGATGGDTGTHIEGISATDAATSASISYTTPVNTRIHQRAIGGNTGTVSATGTYTESPTTIEARLVQDSTNTPLSGFDWSTKVASPSGNAFSFSFASVPQGGWYNVQTRDSANPGTVFTSGKVGVGALFATANQSNAVMLVTKGSSTLTPHALTSVMGRVGPWQSPNAATMDGAITFLNAMRSALGIPCGLLDLALSGSGLDPTTQEAWLPTASSPHYAYWRDAILGLDGKIEGCISVAGENDANAGITQAAYYTAQGTLYAAMRADLGQASLPIALVTLGRIPLANYTTDANISAIRAAQVQKCADAGIYRVDRIDASIDDGIHVDAAGAAAVGLRCAQAFKYAAGLATYYRGPRIASANQVDATHVDVVLAHVNGTDFTPTSSITGFTVLDGATPITVSSAVRQTANSIRLTLASAPAALPTIQYLYGKQPTVTGAVRDNSAIALPLEFNDGVATSPPGSDTTPPTFTGALTVNSITSSSATVDWTATTHTDNVGITDYEYSFNGTSWTATGNTATSRVFNSLTAATNYTVFVRAKDAASNVSSSLSVPFTTSASPGGEQQENSAFNAKQPFATVRTDSGGIYYFQGGEYYDAKGAVVTLPLPTNATGQSVKESAVGWGVDRSLTASTSAQTLMSANMARRGFYIFNDTGIDVYVNIGGTATAAAGGGNIKIAAGANLTSEDLGITPSAAISIISASGSPAITAREF